MITYSVIIPHKNTPELLQRCLKSIPKRDDLEIIIVDDNSDDSIVNFSDFPGNNRENTRIIFEKGRNGKGPGFARNTGIMNARGKWIIFSDSDDYFTDNFSGLLYQHQNDSEEVLFFKCCRQTENNEVKEEYPLFNDAINKSLKENNIDFIAYGVPSPVAKFIKRDFLIQNNIRYQEITGGDDILFSVQIATHLKKYSLSNSKLYCVVDRQGSLTRNSNWKSFYSYSIACMDAYKLLAPVSKEKYAVSWLISWWGFLWAENKFRAFQLIPRIYSKMRFKHASVSIKKGIKRGAWNWREI